MVKRNVSFQKRDKKVDDSITLVLTYHPALNQFYEVLLRPHKHVLKSPRLHGALPSQTRVAPWNPKTIRDKLVLSKLKKYICIKMLASIFVVILILIYVKHLKKKIRKKTFGKNRLRRKNTALIFHFIVTIAAKFIYWHAKYVLNST